MQSTNKRLTQPADWWAAFQRQAEQDGQSLSEWIGEAGKAQLPKHIRKSLSERPAAHRPKTNAEPRLEGK